MTPTIHNLNPDYSRPGTLRRADLPTAAVTTGSWRPAAILSLADGSMRLIVASGSLIGVAADDRTVPAPLDLGREPMAILPAGQQLAVMTLTGRRLFSVSGNSLVEAADPSDIPAGISIGAAAMTSVAAYCQPVTLSKSYSGLRELTRADALRAAANACDIYRTFDSAARASGCLFQPVVAVLRFCRADGSVAFSSAPVVITHPDGEAASASLSFRTLDRQTIAGGLFEVPAWRPQITLPRLNMPEITSAQLVVSPVLYAASPDSSSVVISSLGEYNDFFTATLPQGVADTYGGRDNVIAALAAGLDSCGTVAATIANPFSGLGTVTLRLNLPGDIDSDQAALRSFLVSGKRAAVTSALSSLLAPNSFTATSVAVAGATTLWGGVKAVPFAGFDPSAYAATSSSDPWQGYIKVSFADGASVVRSVSSSSGAPVAFQPLISYPSPQAVAIEIGLRVGSACYLGSYPLTPDSSGRFACYVQPQLRPFPLPAASAYSVPEGSASPVPLPAVIAAAPASSPFDISCVADIGAPPLSAILPARFSQSAWDFGRARFFLFSAAGVRSATVNAPRSDISLGSVDARPCPSGPSSAISTPYGLIALAGSDLILIDGSRVTTIRADVTYDSLIFDFRRHELWCFSRSLPSVDVLCPRLDWLRYTLGIDAADPACVLSSPLGSYLKAGPSILTTDTRTPAPWLPITYQSPINETITDNIVLSAKILSQRGASAPQERVQSTRSESRRGRQATYLAHNSIGGRGASAPTSQNSSCSSHNPARPPKNRSLASYGSLVSPETRRFTVDLHGHVRDLTISLTRHHHYRQAAAPDVSLTLDGPITAPVPITYVPVSFPCTGAAARAQATTLLTITGQAAPALTLIPPP